MKTQRFLPLMALALGTMAAYGTPVNYKLDPEHTYVSLEAPHIPGGSYWRGKFNRTQSGLVSLDRQSHTGHIEVSIDASSVDFGLETLNDMVRGPQFLDVARYPTASFRADTVRFEGDTPVEAIGTLSLHGVEKPLSLKINSFRCIPDQYLKVERCGADASAVIDRSAFAVSNYSQMTGSEVKLAIQVEGLLTGTAASAGSSGG